MAVSSKNCGASYEIDGVDDFRARKRLVDQACWVGVHDVSGMKVAEVILI